MPIRPFFSRSVYALLVIVFFALLGAAIFYLHKSSSPKDAMPMVGMTAAPMEGMDMSHTSMNAEMDPASSSTVALWRTRIREVGSDAAYKEFAASVAKLGPAQAHAQAHLFGAALFAEKGDAGFSVCGNLFSFGCAHALVAAAIQKEGMQAVGTFAAECRTTSWPSLCLHGIGHGLIRATGYTDAAVRKVIGLCLDSVHDTSTAGCIGGAVMEYDGQSMTGGVPDERSLNDKNIYEPCVSAPESAKSSCYFWLVSWWYDSYFAKHISPPDSFAHLGKDCDAMPDKQYLPQCLAGMGEMAASVGSYDATSAIQLCENASSDESARMYCKAYAANILLETPDGNAKAYALCDSVEATEKYRCAFLARNGVSIFDD